MNMGVHGASSEYQLFPGNNLSGWANDQVRVDALLNIRIASFSQADNISPHNTNVTFDNAFHGINHKSICNNNIKEWEHFAITATGPIFDA